MRRQATQEDFDKVLARARPGDSIWVRLPVSIRLGKSGKPRKKRRSEDYFRPGR